MAIANEDTLNSAGDQYKDAFAETPSPVVEQDENEAFGIAPPEEAVAAAEAGEPVADEAVAEEAAAEPEPAAPAAQAASETDQNPAESDEPTDPKEIQRKASWEGRLKKMEADLMARSKASQESPAAAALEDVGEQAEAGGNEALSDAAESVAGQVEDGSMTAAQAMKQLAEDFGEEFVKMIEVIASAKASDIGGQAASSVKAEVDSIISHISDSAEKAHFKEIKAAFPDFNEVGNSEEFKSFVQGAGADAARIAGGGSASEVIQLIQDFKAANAPANAPAEEPAQEPVKETPAAEEEAPGNAAQADPEGADAAAGIRSGGLRLPAEPADNNDFGSAWEEAAKTR